MMKLIFRSFMLLLAIGVILLFVFFEISLQGVKLKDQKRPWLKKISSYISQIVYAQASKHNPSGDLLPDQIDDIIKGKIKEKIN